MKTTKIALFAGAAVVFGCGLIMGIKINPATSTTDGAGAMAALVKPVSPQVDEVNPFTHLASVPVGVDPSTIRFEKLKNVELASKTKTTTDPQRCKELQFRDADGSGCRTVTVLERVKALEVQYSVIGLDLGTGESLPGRQMFSVYFRPEEVVADGPVEKLKRDQAAGMFQVNTYHPMVEQKVIDKEHSHFCAGNYVDGNWVHADPNCKDQVQLISQAVSSPYLAVQVDLRNPATMATH
ncbi:MAG TPA: hypothetical protein VGF49_23350 [Candidatus Solibacter sp.]|jgi:hypothetical protein